MCSQRRAITDRATAIAGGFRLSRRRWLQGCAGGVLLGMIGSVAAHAEGKLPKAAVSYQDHPNGSKRCSTCSHYIPAAKAGEAGRCEIVAGPVGPLGYCIVWADANPKGCT